MPSHVYPIAVNHDFSCSHLLCLFFVCFNPRRLYRRQSTRLHFWQWPVSVDNHHIWLRVYRVGFFQNGQLAVHKVRLGEMVRRLRASIGTADQLRFGDVQQDKQKTKIASLMCAFSEERPVLSFQRRAGHNQVVRPRSSEVYYGMLANCLQPPGPVLVRQRLAPTHLGNVGCRVEIIALNVLCL